MSTAAKAESPMSKSNPAASWASFNWEDPFRLEQQLTDDERLVMDTARQYAQDRLAPRVQEAYRDEKTDPAIFREGCRLLDLPPSACLYVGDLYPVDYLGATGAGLDAVLLDPMGLHEGRAPRVGTLGELPAWIS